MPKKLNFPQIIFKCVIEYNFLNESPKITFGLRIVESNWNKWCILLGIKLKTGYIALQHWSLYQQKNFWYYGVIYLYYNLYTTIKCCILIGTIFEFFDSSKNKKQYGRIFSALDIWNGLKCYHLFFKEAIAFIGVILREKIYIILFSIWNLWQEVDKSRNSVNNLVINFKEFL